MGIDVSLLQVVRALARHGTVTAAAAHLGLTQSTVSYALARLRAHYNDPLFVPAGKQLTRTPLASRLIEEAERILQDFERIESLTETFDPRRSRRRFRIHMIDVAEVLILPGLMHRLSEESLPVEIDVVRIPGVEVWGELESGRLDLVIGTPWKSPPTLFRQKLLAEHYVGIARKGHPLQHQLESLEGYLRCSHCVVKPRGPTLGRMEAALASLYPERRVPLQVMDFLSVPSIVASTDMVAAVPSTLVALHPNRDQLQVFKLPIAQTGFVVMQHWHKRVQSDMANVWLRQLLKDLTASYASLPNTFGTDLDDVQRQGA
jgi:DNA-binding transcriptional LysR family regulator